MKRIPTQMTRPSRSRGFTLLEVLIALVILSIGLLGIATLQGVGLRSSHGAYLTSQASLLAYDIADRIRANPGMIALGGSVATAGGDCALDVSDLPLSDVDRIEWSCSVQTLLPQGSGTVSRVPSAIIAGASTVTINLEWQDLEWQDRQTEDEDEENPWRYELVIEL